MEIRARGRDAVATNLKRFSKYWGKLRPEFENKRPHTHAIIRGFFRIESAIFWALFLNFTSEVEDWSNHDSREMDRIFIMGMEKEIIIPKKRIPSSPRALIITAKPIYVLNLKQLWEKLPASKSLILNRII